MTHRHLKPGSEQPPCKGCSRGSFLVLLPPEGQSAGCLNCSQTANKPTWGQKAFWGSCSVAHRVENRQKSPFRVIRPCQCVHCCTFSTPPGVLELLHRSSAWRLLIALCSLAFNHLLYQKPFLPCLYSSCQLVTFFVMKAADLLIASLNRVEGILH